MLRLFSLLIVVAVLSFGKKNLKDENIQILAEKLEIKNDIVHATGDVVVYSPNYYITANRLIYDKINAKLELFDDVNIIQNNEVISYSQYIFIDVKNDINSLKPMLILDNTSKLWFNAEKGLKDNDNFDLKSSTLSSCDCLDPAWSISFSSGDYNTTKQWMNTYNTTLYIKNFPIFYTPYFGFPTDDTRRTGLLTPTIGYSNTEGFIYAQPIYFAPKLNYDFEYIPQKRFKRGYGHALKYRYADSLYSTLKMETAMFKEDPSYQKTANLTNDKHYGWNLDYKRTKLFSKSSNDSDGLSIELEDMNDVDYINTLYNSSTTNNTDKFLESKMKYFYSTNKYYGDVEVNMYNDISKENNDDVMQKIPTVNLHKYSDGIFNNYLTSSIDITADRQTRKTGIGGKTTNIYVPINYHTYLFDEYLNFSFSEQINYTNIEYSDSKFTSGNFGENNHIFSLYTDLVKPYDDIIHSISFNATYTNSNTFEKSGDLYDVKDSSTSSLSLFPITQTSKNISLGFNQSIYSKSSLKEIVNHKINQGFVYNNDTNTYEKNDLENDLKFNYKYGSLSNRLIYNYRAEEITTSSTTLKFLKDQYFLNMSYVNTLDIDNDTLKIVDEEKNLNYDFGLSFLNDYKLSYKEEYDFIDKTSKKKEYILNVDDKCWAIDFKFVDSLVASNTTTDVDSFRQKILYIEFNLKELFQVNQKYEFKKRD